MTDAAEAIAEGIPKPEEEPSPARIEAFSDAVFAIIITLLVLDVRVPREATLENQSLGAALWQHALRAGLVSPRADPQRLQAPRGSFSASTSPRQPVLKLADPHV